MRKALKTAAHIAADIIDLSKQTAAMRIAENYGNTTNIYPSGGYFRAGFFHMLPINFNILANSVFVTKTSHKNLQ